MTVKEYRERDSRDNDHSVDRGGYWGWTIDRYLCDGKQHHVLSIGQGAWHDRDPECQTVGDCDNIACQRGTEVDVATLPHEAQDKLGLHLQVPPRCILVIVWHHQHAIWRYKVYLGDEAITPAHFSRGVLLQPGEQGIFKNGYQLDKYRVHIIKNRNGKAIILDEEEKHRRRQFALEQLEYLQKIGFTQDQASDIMRVAGPGHVQEAVRWAFQALQVAQNSDAVICVLNGLTSMQFGWERRKEVLWALRLPEVKATSAHAFNRVMVGAQKVILYRSQPGSNNSAAR